MNRYQPIEVPMLLFGVLSEAVPELLEQHHRYEESRLTKFLAEYYPEIPENLRGPIVTAASLGAKRTALMHTVAEKNLHSDNPEKRRIVAEAANSLSFWSSGLRPSFRSDSVLDDVVTSSVQTAGVLSRSVLAQPSAFSSTLVS